MGPAGERAGGEDVDDAVADAAVHGVEVRLVLPRGVEGARRRAVRASEMGKTLVLVRHMSMAPTDIMLCITGLGLGAAPRPRRWPDMPG